MIPKEPHTLPAALVLALSLSLAGCGQSQAQLDRETAVRRLIEEVREAAVARDYERMWELCDSSTQLAVEKQLNDFRSAGDSGMDAFVGGSLDVFGLEPADLEELNGKEYFVALIEGLDRTRPDLRARQIEATRQRQITQINWQEYAAVVTAATPDGETIQTTVRKEGADWRVVADVGEGISIQQAFGLEVTTER